MKPSKQTLRAAALALAVGIAAGYGLRGLSVPAAPPAAPVAEVRAPLPERTELSRVQERAEEVQGERLVMRTEEPWRLPPPPRGLKAADELSAVDSCARAVRFVKIGNDWEGRATRPVLTNESKLPLKDVRARIDINGREKVWRFPVIAPGQTVKGEGRLQSPDASLIRIGFSVSEAGRAYAPLARGAAAPSCDASATAGYFQLSRD